MKIKYSPLSVISFFSAVAFRAFGVPSSHGGVADIGFLTCVLLCILFIWANTRKREFLSVCGVQGKSRKSIAVFSVVGCVGFFADFMFNALRIHSIASSNQGYTVVSLVTYGITGIIAIVCAVCMVMVAMSFSRNTRYDFRELRVLNIAPLLWAIFKGASSLQEFSQILDLDAAVGYITVVFSILSFFCFAKEVDNDGNAYGFSAFSFKSFGCISVLNLFCQMVNAVTNRGDMLGANTISSYIMLCVGLFSFSVGRSISQNSKAE